MMLHVVSLKVSGGLHWCLAHFLRLTAGRICTKHTARDGIDAWRELADIDPEGNLIDPVRVEWASGGIFTTPPGWWHSHHNDTDTDAWVLPIQVCVDPDLQALGVMLRWACIASCEGYPSLMSESMQSGQGFGNDVLVG